MEETTKKRRICHQDGDRSDDEEEKMEKFFALIRSIREAHDHILKASGESLQRSNKNKNKNKKMMRAEEEKPKAVWNPSFQSEDFMEDVQFRSDHITSLAGSSPIKEGNDHKEEIKDGLDLKLSL